MPKNDDLDGPTMTKLGDIWGVGWQQKGQKIGDLEAMETSKIWTFWRLRSRSRWQKSDDLGASKSCKKGKILAIWAMPKIEKMG